MNKPVAPSDTIRGEEHWIQKGDVRLFAFEKCMGDPAATAAGILQILGSTELRAAMSRAGVARAKRFYAEELLIDAYRELYRALASGTRVSAAAQPPHLELV